MLLDRASIEKSFEEKWALVDFLPYDDVKENVFIQVDGSLGCIWEIRPVEAELFGAAALEEISNAFSGLVGRVPADMACQMIMIVTRDVKEKIAVYEKALINESDALSLEVTVAKRHNLEKKKEGDTKEEGRVVAARSVKVFFTLRKFSREHEMRGIKGSMKKRGEDASGRAAFLGLSQGIESQFKAMNVQYAPLGERELLGLVYSLLNPRRVLKVPIKGNDALPLREQMLYNAPLSCGDGFVFEGVFTRVMTLKDLPPITTPGMFLSFLGGVSLLDIPGDFMQVFNFTVPDQAKEMEKIKFQKAFAFLQRRSSTGDVSEEAEEKKEELGAVITDLFRGGRSIVRARSHIVLFNTSKEAVERSCDVALSVFHRLGAGALKEEIIAPSLFLTCLPLNFDPRFEPFVRRSRRLFSDNLADMLPVYGGLQGTITPAAMYLNRRGEAVFLDFFDSATNPHAVILGASGAGKSFFTNDLIFQNYRLGGRFFVLDRGHSYRKTCEILGGEYVSFDLNEPITVNPFFRKPTMENMAFLVDVLCLMASGGDDRDRVTREERGFLQMSALEAYERHSDREVFLSDAVDVLRDVAFAERKGVPEEMGMRLALRLVPFTRKGQYGAFFDGPNQFEPGGRFTVFELSGLSGYPDLQAVVLVNVMFFITQFVSLASVRGERKFLLIDEAWQLLKTANTAEFIAGAFKTFRKYRCAAVAITQEVSDLLRQECGVALLANSANKIFLKQESGIIERVKKEMSLSDEVEIALKSLKTVRGEYSESLMMTPVSSGVIRLFPDPFLYWASTSEARENEYLSDVRQKMGGDLFRAITQCAKEFPNGLR